MNQMKVGEFLATLRKEKGLTQAQLGEEIGVTNKTISRWENGNYMPDVEMLLVLSEFFGVTVGEILKGERQTPEEIISSSNETISQVIRNDRFTMNERTKFWKNKWLKENLFAIVLCIIVWLGLFPVCYFFLGDGKTLGGGVVVLMGVIGVGYWRDRMVAYIEKHIYDNTNK